jgi:hypothetical protein
MYTQYLELNYLIFLNCFFRYQTGFRCPRPLFKFEHADFPGNS